MTGRWRRAPLVVGLAVLFGPCASANADAKQANEILDSYTTVLSMAYPPAGPVFQAALKFLNLTGYLGSTADPVGDAIKEINQRLSDLETRMHSLEQQIQQVQNQQFKDENLARVRQLGTLHREIQSVAFALAQKPTDGPTKMKLANDARLAVNEFVTDHDLWTWSDLALKDHTWNGKTVKAGQYLPPDFKPMPTLEYYSAALITWMAAIDYAAAGNAGFARQNYGADLQKHIDFLTARPGWNELRDQPVTLPEQVRSRIQAVYVPDKYPRNRIAHISEYTRDSLAREVRYVEELTYTANSDNELVNVPAGLLSRPSAREEELAAAYGTDLMDGLVKKLTYVLGHSTIKQERPIWETTPLVSPDWTGPPHPVPIYSIEPDGTLYWLRHDGGLDGSAKWQPKRRLTSGWGGYLHVFADSYGILYAVTVDGKLLWFRHLGYSNGSTEMDARSGKQVASGFDRYRILFSTGQGVMYGMTDDGDLYWYRYLGYRDGSTGAGQWKGPLKIGNGWNDCKFIFSTGEGVIYSVYANGLIRWWRHGGWQTGGGYETWEGPKPLRNMGSYYKQMFAGDSGIIYGVAPNNDLHWFLHVNYLEGPPAPPPPPKPGQPQKPIKTTGKPDVVRGPHNVGNGWNCKFVFAAMPDPFVGPK